MNKLEKGDVVKTQNSNLHMCISSIFGTQVYCMWFEDQTLFRDFFHRNSLIKIEKT